MIFRARIMEKLFTYWRIIWMEQRGTFAKPTSITSLSSSSISSSSGSEYSSSPMSQPTSFLYQLLSTLCINTTLTFEQVLEQYSLALALKKCFDVCETLLKYSFYYFFFFFMYAFFYVLFFTFLFHSVHYPKFYFLHIKYTYN
jgi:hypothetical protein